MILYNNYESCPSTILNYCAGYGHINILNYYLNLSLVLNQRDLEDTFNKPTIDAYGYAVATGQIDVLDWLYLNNINMPYSDGIDFMYEGQINMLSTLILKSKYVGEFTKDKSDKLCLEVYKWLIDHGLAIDEWMYCEAGSAGNIHILDFLEYKGCSMQNVALDSICSGGSIPGLEWFYKRNILPTVDDLCETNSLELIKWAVSHGIGPSINWLKYDFCSKDDTSILDYFSENLHILPDIETANVAYKKNAINYLLWMKERNIVPTDIRRKTNRKKTNKRR